MEMIIFYLETKGYYINSIPKRCNGVICIMPVGWTIFNNFNEFLRYWKWIDLNFFKYSITYCEGS